jgi:hypothetical protein
MSERLQRLLQPQLIGQSGLRASLFFSGQISLSAVAFQALEEIDRPSDAFDVNDDDDDDSLTDVGVVGRQHAHVGNVHLTTVAVVQRHLHHVLLKGRRAHVHGLDGAREKAVVHLAPVDAHPGANRKLGFVRRSNFLDLSKEGLSWIQKSNIYIIHNILSYEIYHKNIIEEG